MLENLVLSVVVSVISVSIVGASAALALGIVTKRNPVSVIEGWIEKNL